MLQRQRPRRRDIHMTTSTPRRRGRLPLALATGLGLLLLLSGCSAGSAPEAGTPASGGDVGQEYRDEAGTPDGGVPEAPAVPGDRKIARSATLELVVADVDRAASELRRVATLVGGMVTSESLQLSTDSEPGGYGTSELVVTVPSSRLDETLTLIAGLGKVTRRAVDSVDVTDTVVDVDSRVKTLRESIARLQALMERAGSVSDIAAVEAELTSRQSELEAMLARQQALQRQVDSSPVAVTLVTEATTLESDGPAGFLSGLESGWNAMVVAGQVGLTIVGALLPWLGVAAVVAAPLWWWGRRHRHVRTGTGKAGSQPPEGRGGA